MCAVFRTLRQYLSCVFALQVMMKVNNGVAVSAFDRQRNVRVGLALFLSLYLSFIVTCAQLDVSPVRVKRHYDVESSSDDEATVSSAAM